MWAWFCLKMPFPCLTVLLPWPLAFSALQCQSVKLYYVLWALMYVWAVLGITSAIVFNLATGRVCRHDVWNENNSLLSNRVACSKELYSAVLFSFRDFQEHGFIWKPLNKFTSEQASDTYGGRERMWQFGKVAFQKPTILYFLYPPWPVKTYGGGD